MSDEESRSRRVRSLRTAAILSSAGLTLAFSVAIGAGIGYLLDRALGTTWLVIIFTIVGVAAGFKQFIQTVIRANEEQEALDREERERRERDEDGGS
jgi:F0F1-type ATP synthase assembly protein I